jgi:hypothetical protein
MPILVLAARPMRPFALKVYRFFGFKKMQLSFCIFSMPVPHTVVQYVPYLVFFSLNSRQYCHCVSPRLNVWAQKVVWPVSNPTATLSFDLLIALNLFCCTWQRLTHQHLRLAATFTGLASVQVLLSQMTPDDFFAHSKGNTSRLIRRDFSSPFLDQFISFCSSYYSMMPRYPY